jgi:hypothetical protein
MRRCLMSAQVILGKAVFTVPEADHLQVVGELVQIQRSGPDGYETIAVAGEDMLVTIQPAEPARPAEPAGLHWHPVGEPLD